mgnify:CR=1 FL=1
MRGNLRRRSSDVKARGLGPLDPDWGDVNVVMDGSSPIGMIGTLEQTRENAMAVGQVAGALLVLAGLVLSGPAMAEADGPDFWRVVGVRADDVLNLHPEPTARSKTIAGIPYDANGLRNLGCRSGPTFAQWQRMTDAEREASKRARWCQVEYQGSKGWVAGRFLAEGAPPSAGKAGGGGGSVKVGPWRADCSKGVCALTQTGIAAAKRTVIRIAPEGAGNARIAIERAGMPRRGTLTIYMDGETISAGPLQMMTPNGGGHLEMAPDDVASGLMKQMARHKTMVLSFPGEDRGVEFHLDAFDEALKALERLAGKGN